MFTVTLRLASASSSWVQQASRRKTGLGASASGPGADLTQNVPLGSRVVSQKVNFWGQGNKGSLISSAVRRRTGEYPPGRLLLPGGLCCPDKAPKKPFGLYTDALFCDPLSIRPKTAQGSARLKHKEHSLSRPPAARRKHDCVLSCFCYILRYLP